MSARLMTKPRIAASLWLVVSTLYCSGCHQSMYQANALPPQLAARPALDASSLDLSVLAAPAYGNDQIFPGDALKVSVVTGADPGKPDEWPVRVMDDGSVQLPMVGRLVLSGQDLEAAQDAIRLASMDRGVFTNPSVTLSIEEHRTNRVSVVGAVEEPGDYELPTGRSDLLAALLAAGNLTEDADRYIEIRRARPAMGNGDSMARGHYLAQASHLEGSPGNSTPTPSSDQIRITRVDLVAATQNAQPTPILLNDGDVVTVRKRPPRYVYVIGLVHRPDRFELKASESVRLLDAIALAGGVTLSIADRVVIVRESTAGAPVTIQASLREAKNDAKSNLMLADGDVVSVEETPVTYTIGTLQNVVRFGINGFF